MEHACRAYTHTFSLPYRAGEGLLAGPRISPAPWRAREHFYYFFLPVPPRRHADISPELEQREGDLKKESEKNKRKRKEGRRETRGKREREC